MNGLAQRWLGPGRIRILTSGLRPSNQLQPLLIIRRLLNGGDGICARTAAPSVTCGPHGKNGEGYGRHGRRDNGDPQEWAPRKPDPIIAAPTLLPASWRAEPPALLPAG